MDFYPDQPSIDLREEFAAVLHGRVDMIGQGRPVLLRQFTDTPCACWDQQTGSPQQDCPYCQGEGFQFYETTQTFYIARGVAPVYKPGFLATGQYPQTSYGYTDPNRATGYCEWFVFPNYERLLDGTKKIQDVLYELKVGPEGGLFYPVTRVAKWKILTYTPLHGDNGRVEFFELGLEKTDF